MKHKLISTAHFLIDCTAIPFIVVGYYSELIKDAYKLGKSCYNRNK